jgi:hypothetical protein
MPLLSSTSKSPWVHTIKRKWFIRCRRSFWCTRFGLMDYAVTIFFIAKLVVTRLAPFWCENEELEGYRAFNTFTGGRCWRRIGHKLSQISGKRPHLDLQSAEIHSARRSEETKSLAQLNSSHKPEGKKRKNAAQNNSSNQIRWKGPTKCTCKLFGICENEPTQRQDLPGTTSLLNTRKLPRDFVGRKKTPMRDPTNPNIIHFPTYVSAVQFWPRTFTIVHHSSPAVALQKTPKRCPS